MPCVASSSEEEAIVSTPLVKTASIVSQHTNGSNTSTTDKWREERSAMEERIRILERDLRLEREDKKRREAEMNLEHDRETNDAERRWMEQLRGLREERDRLQGDALVLEEQLETAAAEVNRAVASRYELEDRTARLKAQFDALAKDYDDTMQERSTVLEENSRLSEERDGLRVSVKQISTALHNKQTEEGEQMRALAAKLESTRRMLQQDRHSKDMDEMKELRNQLQSANREREEAIRMLGEKLSNVHGDELTTIVDHWSTHAFSVSLQTKGNLGIVLEGGSAEGGRRHHLPIYVKDVLVGSPLESFLRRLDHIVMVNDIDVSEMDVRSVVDILRNSHHLKMVVKRRTSLHRVVQLPVKASGTDFGLELSTGVFVNRLEKGGVAERSGIRLGNRLIYINGTPVYDARHADELMRKEAPNGTVTLCFLNGAQRQPSVGGVNGSGSISKQKTLLGKVHEKLFRRSNSSTSSPSSSNNTEKSHVVVARANIDESAGRGGDYFIRHGSLRLPSQNVINQQQFIRTGSLRAPQGSVDHKKIIDSLDRYLQGHSSRASPLTTAPSSDIGSTWPKSRELLDNIPEPVVRRRVPPRPSVFPVFSAPPPPPLESSRNSHCSCSSPTPWSPPSSTAGGHNAEIRAAYSPSPVPSSVQCHRMSTYSPALPQPPPYPGPRFCDDSLSSIVSSTNSVPHKSTSSTLNRRSRIDRQQPNNSPSESDAEVRRVCLSKEESGYAPEFGVGLENGVDGGVYVAHVHGRRNTVQKGDRVLDIGGINMRSADKTAASRVLSQFHASQDEVTMTVAGRLPAFWATVHRSSIKLCGGNAVSILIENAVGDLQPGDRIIELDGFDLRAATLEEAFGALGNGRSEVVDVLAQRGGDAIERLRAGADGDGFYVRMNADRVGETNDELDVKQGEIVYVDNTVFMGQRGRWRAWRVDREGRQRQCGIIPSASVVESGDARLRKQNKSSRPPSSLCRPIYERVEKVSSAQRRPVLLFGAVISPFTQALLDDPANKFSPCVPECCALSAVELDLLSSSGQVVDVRRRDKLFDVISATAVRTVVESGVHCILDVSPSAIARLHTLKIYPIVIKIKFKSAKQIKELKEELGETRTTTKQAKDLLDRSLLLEAQLDAADCVVAVVPVGAQTPAKTLVKHVCQQIMATVEHEQKKSVWVTAPH